MASDKYESVAALYDAASRGDVVVSVTGVARDERDDMMRALRDAVRRERA